MNQNNVQQQQVQQMPTSLFQQTPEQIQIQQQYVQQPIVQQQMFQQPMMQTSNNRSQNSRGGVFGTQYNTNSNPQQPFNDDQAPILQAKFQEKQKNEQSKIQIQVKAQRTMIKLKQKCYLPSMIQVKTTGGNRTSVDLICVLDISGSMSGKKIKLLKQTMKFLIDTLTPSDRLCIITFNNWAKRICPLKPVTKENIPLFNAWIDSIIPGGGTRIITGMQTAIRVMKERVYKNSVTSLFLLSDGQDDKNTHKNLQKIINQSKDLETFSIQSFGFGSDHDQDLMTNIANVMDGNFFYISQLATLDQAFCSALGGVISVVAKQFIINLQNISKGLLKDVKISKTFGTMWKKNTQSQFQIKILQLMGGVQKNYVFELQIPNIDANVGDLERQNTILSCSYKAKNIKDEVINGQCTLKLILLNSQEQIPQINQNVDVLENYLRLKASQQIQQAIQQSQMNMNEAAQNNLDKFISSIQQNKKVRRQKMQPLLNDLRKARNNCQRQQFQSYGRKQMRNAQWAHREQKANHKMASYQNNVQTEMLSDLRSKKMQ